MTHTHKQTLVVKFNFIIILSDHLVTRPQFATILQLKTKPNLKISVSWSTFVNVSNDITYLNKTSLTLVMSVLFRPSFSLHTKLSGYSHINIMRFKSNSYTIEVTF